MTDAYKTQTQQQVLEQSIEVVRRRIDEMGTREPDHHAPGRRPHPGAGAGPAGPAELKAILGKTAKMTFQLVDETGRSRLRPPCRPATKMLPDDRAKHQNAPSRKSSCSAG